MEISCHSSSLCRNFAFGSSPFPKQRLVNEPKMKIRKEQDPKRKKYIISSPEVINTAKCLFRIDHVEIYDSVNRDGD